MLQLGRQAWYWPEDMAEAASGQGEQWRHVREMETGLLSSLAACTCTSIVEEDVLDQWHVLTYALNLMAACLGWQWLEEVLTDAAYICCKTMNCPPRLYACAGCVQAAAAAAERLAPGRAGAAPGVAM